KRAAKLPSEERTVEKRLAPARLDALRGRFDQAEEQATALAREVDASPNAAPHAAAARLLIAVRIETGRPRGAQRVPEAFLAKKAAWNRDDRPYDDPVPLMLHTLARGGKTTEAEATARADAWLAEMRRSERVNSVPLTWVYAHAQTIASREEAERALAKQD